MRDHHFERAVDEVEKGFEPNAFIDVRQSGAVLLVQMDAGDGTLVGLGLNHNRHAGIFVEEPLLPFDVHGQRIPTTVRYRGMVLAAADVGKAVQALGTDRPPLRQPVALWGWAKTQVRAVRFLANTGQCRQDGWDDRWD